MPTDILRILMIIACLTAQQAAAQQSAEPQTRAMGGELRVEQAVRNFDPSWTGLQLRHDFELQNTGKDELTIQRIDFMPGCYVVGEYQKTIAPGEKTTLSLAVDTREITGDFERTATLYTSDSRTPRVVLRLRGSCQQPIDIQPSFIGFGKLLGDGPHQRSATLRNRTDESFELTLVTKEDSNYTFELIETTPGEEYKLFATTKVPMAQGRVESFVTLQTSLEAQPELRVRVFAYMPPRLEIIPATIVLEPDKLANSPRGLTKVVLYSNNGDKPVHLKGAMVDDPEVQITTSEIMAGKSYRIVVQVPPGYKLPDHGAHLTLQTDDHVFAQVRVPIRMAASPGDPQVLPSLTDDTMITKMIGQKAPRFELTTHEGLPLTNAQLAQSVTVLNFFVLGDPHNFQQLHKFEKLRERFAPRGIRFVNVSQRSPYTDVTQERHLEVFEGAGFKSELAFDLGNTVGTAFHLILYPTMVVLGKTGVIEAVIEGNEDDLIERAEKQFETLLSGRSLVAGPTPAEKQRRPALTMIGQKSPDFSLRVGDDHSLSSAQLADAPVTVLNFVAPNCGFCRRQVPVVEAVRAHYETLGVRFVNVGQTMRKEFTREEVEKVLSEVGSHLALAHDPKNEVGRRFKVTSYPTLAIIRRDGQIEDVIIGAKKDLDELLRGQLDKLLSKDSGASR